MLALTFIYLLTACDNSSRQTNTVVITEHKIDTLKAIKIGNYWATPKKAFELNSLLDSFGDTLLLVTCSDYVYSPFGKIENRAQVKTSILKNFNIIDRSDSMDNGVFEFQILNLNSSKLILFFDNNPESTTHSYVFKGEIIDTTVVFENGVKIGMNKEKFVTTFFDSFPIDLLPKYKVVVFETCVTGMKHIYTFKENKLLSVSFISDSYWNVNY